MHLQRKPLIKIFMGFPVVALPMIFASKGVAQDIDRYIDRYVLVQPIQVCYDSIPICSKLSLYERETDKIWNQAGIDVLFLDTVQFKDSSFLVIDEDLEFHDLAFSGPPGSFGRHPNSGANQGPLNLWAVDDIPSDDSDTTIFGSSWIGSNGIIINDLTFELVRLDTIAHEIGHSFGLDHGGGANNLMESGSDRTVPIDITDIAPDGANLSQLTAGQVSQARTSSFLNAIPKIAVNTTGPAPFSRDDFFHVEFLDDIAGLTLKSLTVDLATTNAFFDILGGPFGSGTNESPLNLDLASLTGISESDITVSNLDDLTSMQITDRSRSMILDFVDGAFEVGDSFNFGLNLGFFGLEPLDLEGAEFTFEFSDNYSVVAALNRVMGELNNFTANSHTPIRNPQLTEPLPPVSNPPPQQPPTPPVLSEPIPGSDPSPTPTPNPISMPEPSGTMPVWLALGASVLTILGIRPKTEV